MPNIAGKHTEYSATKALSKKQDCFIAGHIIQIRYGDKATKDLGIKSWGKIDFLRNHCGYAVTRVKNFN